MSTLSLSYRHNTDPQRGLAAVGIIGLKFLLVLPHAIVANALQYVAAVLAYIGYWAVALTGSMPQAVHRLTEITLGWSARSGAWIAGLVDLYPPFETDPDYPVAFAVPEPENPNRGWAIAGILFLKFIAAIPHFIVMSVLAVGVVVAVWIGYIIVAFTGQYPTGIQDFAAGVMQWGLRVGAWLAGITDDYPPFSLDVQPAE